MQQRVLGASGIGVSAIGLGCMGMSEFYGPSDERESRDVLRAAIDLGVSFFDTADTYGHGANETLVGAALKADRDRVVIATKFGVVREPGRYERRIATNAAYVRDACDASLRRLGIDRIDLYYAHRLNPEVPIEETVGAMADLVKAGKVRALGLCEVSAGLLRRAHAVHPISAVQSEYSLFTREVEAEILPACADLGIAFVPYSPLGRGMLTGAIAAGHSFAAGDFRGSLPRFSPENLDANAVLAERLRQMATERGNTPAQLALAWLLARGPDIVPIPGTRKEHRLRENLAAAEIVLAADDLAALDRAMPPGSAAGDRYTDAGMVGIDFRG